MNYLKLRNLQKGTEFIVGKCSNEDFHNECKELYNDLKDTYDNDAKEKDTTRYIFTDNSCEIYALNPVIKQGYIWKSTTLKRIDLFKIELIEEYPQKTQDIILEEVPTKHYQYGYGYSKNIVKAQFPLSTFPMELSQELKSKLKLVRESYLTDSENDTDNDSFNDTESSELILESNSGCEESDTDTDDTSSEQVLLRKKML